MADGFIELTKASLETSQGISELNRMLSTLFNTSAGDNESVRVFSGSGTPEGNVVAGIGSLYMRTDGSTDTSVYRKESGTGATGWVAIEAGGVPSATSAFLVKPTSQQSNIVAGSQVTVVWGTEIFDVGGDFASNTFTAPDTGKYQLNVTLILLNVDTAVTFVELLLKTSNRDYEFTIYPNKLLTSDGDYVATYSVIADMDANDTAHVTVYQNTGGTNQMDISINSYFSGSLI